MVLKKIKMEFLTLKEVSNLLRVSTKTIKRWLKLGNIPAIKVGRQWRFNKEDIELYLREKRFEFGTTSIKHLFFRDAVLDKYRKESMSGQKYYLSEEAFSGKLGNRQEYHDTKTLTSLKRKLPTGYKPFVDIFFRKVTLKDGSKAVLLEPKQYQQMPSMEYKHWIKYQLTVD